SAHVAARLRIRAQGRARSRRHARRPGAVVKSWLVAAVLVALGCVQMLGDLMGQPAIKAIGLSTQVSPAPKVFTAQNGFETYSSTFHIDWLDAAGTGHTMELTPR